jgi:DNA-binding MarR family transcriptional regulator
VEAAFVAAWDTFFRAVRRRRGRDAQEAGAGLSNAQFFLIEGLVDGPQTVGATALAAGVSAPTASRMIDGLVADGFLVRTPSAADRRLVEVSLTPAGRAAVDAKAVDILRFRAGIVAALTEEQREAAVEILLRLAEAVDEG